MNRENNSTPILAYLILAFYGYWFIAWVFNTLFLINALFSDESTAKEIIIYAVGTCTGILSCITVWL